MIDFILRVFGMNESDIQIQIIIVILFLFSLR